MTLSAEDGSVTKLVVNMTDSGTYSLDWGGDGAVEVRGTYRTDGDQIVVKDDEGSGDCAGKRGLYSFSTDGSTLVMTRIEDECENRGGPDGKMEFKREQ